jgi:glycosyltransferase involved in cell wall biosynthesis
LTRAFTGTIGRYIVPSRFAGTVLLRAQVPANRIDVVPCMVAAPRSPASAQAGEYIGFAGRLADEKGVGVLLRAAAMMPTVPFRIAGDGPLRNELSATAPPNVSFASHLEGDALSEFYRGARIIVVPSLWYETFGIVPAEAMSHQVPVVASRIGALEELVVDRVTGLLFDRGDAADLVRKIAALWPHPELCREMGRRGRAKIASECGEDSHATGLLASYRRAVFGHTRDARITGAA